MHPNAVHNTSRRRPWYKSLRWSMRAVTTRKGLDYRARFEATRSRHDLQAERYLHVYEERDAEAAVFEQLAS